MYSSNSDKYHNDPNSLQDPHVKNQDVKVLNSEKNNNFENSSYLLKGIPVDIPKSRHGFPPKPKPIHINNPKNLVYGEGNNSPTCNLLQPRIPVKHLLHTGVPIALFHRSYSTSNLQSDDERGITLQQNNINVRQSCYEQDSPSVDQVCKINNMMKISMNSISTDSNISSISTKTKPSGIFTSYNDIRYPLSKRIPSTKSLEGMISETSTDSNIDSAGGLINNYYESQKPPEQPNSWVLSKCRNCAAPFVPKYKIIRSQQYPKENVNVRNVNNHDSQFFKSDQMINVNRTSLDSSGGENKKQSKSHFVVAAADRGSRAAEQNSRVGDESGSTSIYGQSHKSNCSSISTSTNNDNNCISNDIRTGFCSSSVYGIEPQPLSRSTSSGIGATLSQSRTSSGNCGTASNFNLSRNRSSIDSYSEASFKTLVTCKQNQNFLEIDDKVVPTNSPSSDTLKGLSQDKLRALSLSRSFSEKDSGISQNDPETNLVPPSLSKKGSYECEHKTTVENYDSVVFVDALERFDNAGKYKISKDGRPLVEKKGKLNDIFSSNNSLQESCITETRKYQKFCSGECRISYRQVQKLKRQRSRQLKRQQYIEGQKNLQRQRELHPERHQTMYVEQDVACVSDKGHMIKKPIEERKLQFEQVRHFELQKNCQDVNYDIYDESGSVPPKRRDFNYPSDEGEEWDEDDDDEEGYTNIDEYCYDEDMRYTDMKNKNSLFF